MCRLPLRKKAGQTEPLVIQQPSLTLFGTAVPQYFYKALSGRMLNNGLFARTLVLDAGPRSRGRMPVVLLTLSCHFGTTLNATIASESGCGSSISSSHPGAYPWPIRQRNVDSSGITRDSPASLGR